ncbi:PTS sugar transporter subunit IIA [Rubrivivax sp. A210]|uniref:PTS sugar transporter subunit IIA n=1 Tax=Rubrivivax sp. A210 TaxID=2772301 RepID=UPI001917A664|nr:PTS fructose transporter subunit IIA [Rubrivivax sp. A210]
MVSLLLVAHTPLASSLKAVAQHVYPDCTRLLEAVDVGAGASLAETEQQVRQALASLPEGDVLILADVFGATPCSAALAAADGARTRVVAGVSVPMLWRTLCYCDMPLDDLVTRAVAGAAQGAMHVAVPRRQNQPTPPANHDPDQHHDQ